MYQMFSNVVTKSEMPKIILFIKEEFFGDLNTNGIHFKSVKIYLKIRISSRLLVYSRR